MEEVGYNITEKEFKQISKWAENVYNIAVIVDYGLLSALNGHAHASALCRQSASYQINLK